MLLNKEIWTKNDIDEFHDYLYSLRNKEKIEWERNIVNTKMNVLAIKSEITRDISKNIFKGNYISYLDLMPHKYFEETIIDAYVISKIKNFDIQKKYILSLSKYIDSWSTVDTFKYYIKNNEDNYINFSKELVKHDKPFYRRIGVRILFSFVKNADYIDEVFNIIKSLYTEEEYYVNMAVAWLMCELFIKNRDKTLNFIQNNKFNKFVINKAISKCRDSFRVSDEDKKLLLNYRCKE